MFPIDPDRSLVKVKAEINLIKSNFQLIDAKK
jgi:hypothetical protein